MKHLPTRTPLSPSLLLLCMLYCSTVGAASLNIKLADEDGAAVDDAVVYIKSIDGAVPVSSPGTVTVDQIGEAFVPHVRATTVGSQVVFPNSDHIRHHVYSFSETKTFEVPLYIGIPAEPILFDKAGIVTLGCNIHDHMLGYILVLDTPYYAEISEGSGYIYDIPPGTLALEIWHPRLLDAEVLTQSLVAGPDSQLELTLQIKLRPERMVRRAPKRNSTRY